MSGADFRFVLVPFVLIPGRLVLCIKLMRSVSIIWVHSPTSNNYATVADIY
jgi:hypothetical protein